MLFAYSTIFIFGTLILLHSERPKLYTGLAFQSAIGLTVNKHSDKNQQHILFRPVVVHTSKSEPVLTRGGDGGFNVFDGGSATVGQLKLNTVSASDLETGKFFQRNHAQH